MRSPLIDVLAQRARDGHLTASLQRGPWEHPHPPASRGEIARAEVMLGFALPSLLRDLYAQVANGGFGPGYGLFGVPVGTAAERARHDRNIVDMRNAFRDRRSRHARWPDTLLPVCYWGASRYSYLDCATTEAPVMALDAMAHGVGPWGSAVSLHAVSFEDWMMRWAAGEDLWKSFNAVGAGKLRFEEAAAWYDPGPDFAELASGPMASLRATR